jgi:hypothetical protein
MCDTVVATTAMTGAAELSFVAPQRQIKRHLAKSRQAILRVINRSQLRALTGPAHSARRYWLAAAETLSIPDR